MNNLRSRAAGLVLVVAAMSATLLPLGLAQASPAPAASQATRQIAVSTLGQDFRATLTAIRGPHAGLVAATVTLAVYKRHAGRWELIGRQTVGESNAWFWKVVTSDDAVCLLSASSLFPYPVQVRLLVSDSIGCSAATYNFHIDKYGTLVSG